MTGTHAAMPAQSEVPLCLRLCHNFCHLLRLLAPDSVQVHKSHGCVNDQPVMLPVGKA